MFSLQLNDHRVMPRSIWQRCSVAVGALLNSGARTNPKPHWAKVPDRVWQRHSAYLAEVHHQQQRSRP